MKQRLSVAFAACVLVLWSVFALAQMPQPFSADMSTTSANGNVNMKAKVFISVPKMRFDMSETDQRQNSLFGHKMNMIVDGDSNMAYILMPDAQMYMEFLADAKNPMLQRMPNVQDFKNDPCAGRQDVLCKKVGTETVNGRSCDKWESTDKTGNKETLWIDQKLHFPIKSQTAGGMTTEFTNIKEGAQDPALFKVPAGYRKFDAAAMGGQRPH
jgi:hypothetical protein